MSAFVVDPVKIVLTSSLITTKKLFVVSQCFGLYWTGLTLLNGFPFLVEFFSFYFGSCARLSWLNCQLSSTR